MYIGGIDLMNKDKDMDQEIRLYRNPKKTRKLLTATGLSCGVLLAIFLYSLGLFDGELKIKPVVGSGVLLLILGILFIRSVLSLKDKSPQIIVSIACFSGRTAPLTKAFGEGYWKDVTTIYLEKIGGDTVVVVCLQNNEIYRKRLSKMFLQMAEHDGQLRIMYSAAEIDLAPQDLYTLFERYWHGYKAFHGEGV